jgi:hypothetical protein
MSKPIVLVDLEGTLTNCEHRIKSWEVGDFDTWNEGLHLDKPKLNVLDLVLELSDHCKIFIATAKPYKYYDDVYNWLRKHLPFEPDMVLMRPDGNEDTSPILKGLWVDKLREEGHTIALAIDDRTDVLDMYNDKGLMIVDASAEFNASEIINGVISGMAITEAGYEESENGAAYLHRGISNPTVPDLLRASADMYEERNKTYGDSYKEFGPIMSAFFPDGIALDHHQDMNRHAILTMMMAKLQRYCNNFHKGGHKDSLIDLSTYSAMLNELDGEA